MEDLEKAAQEAIDSKIYDKDMNLYIKERWGKELKPWEKQFIKEVLKGLPAYKAYMVAKGTVTKLATAKTGAYRILRRLEISFEELLEFNGHGADDVSEALTALKYADQDAYLRHITKLKKLDVQKIEHSGSITLPVIKIEGF